MKSRSKIVASVLAGVLAASTIAVPAYAASPDNKKPTTGAAILPALAGPLAAAALVGPTTSSFTLVKNFHFKIWDSWGWKKVFYLKHHGWEVDKYIRHYKVKVHAEKTKSTSSRSAQGKAIVGCVMGSALGAISASIRKATALGNPPRWRSQAEHEAIVKSGYEKQFELTSGESATALSFCGAGSLFLTWQKQAPAVIKAKF